MTYPEICFTKPLKFGDSDNCRERKDKGCMTRDRPQAYFLACDEDSESGCVSSPSPVKGFGVDPYVEVKASGSSTVVRRRVSSR